MSQVVGLRARRRTDLGEDEPVAANNTYWANWTLAQPRQRTLFGECVLNTLIIVSSRGIFELLS